jgi:hypothetical protein
MTREELQSKYFEVENEIDKTVLWFAKSTNRIDRFEELKAEAGVLFVQAVRTHKPRSASSRLGSRRTSGTASTGTPARSTGGTRPTSDRSTSTCTRSPDPVPRSSTRTGSCPASGKRPGRSRACAYNSPGN